MTPRIHFVLLTVLLTVFSLSLAAEQEAKTHEIRRALQYLLHLPEDYENQASWPLILFLHGAGERGDNIEAVKTHGPPKIVAQDPAFGFIVVSPQCPAGQRWNAPDLMDLLNHIKSHYKVNPDRVYLTGLSMGGYGTWDMAANYPREFAAIAPICGGGNPRAARRLGELPIWVFHGAKDTVVPMSESEAMIAAVEKAGGTPKFTIYPDAGHDSWTESYNNKELYAWFLSHKRKPASE